MVDRAKYEIEEATKSLIAGNFQKKFCNNVVAAKERALTDLSLFIDGYSKVLVLKKLKKAIIYLPKLIW